MPEIRIQAYERVHYVKILQVEQETLDHFLESAREDRPESSDFNLDPHDIDGGELDLDDFSIDVRENGKWKPLFPE